MKCPTCNAEMRPLLTGVYCPNSPHEMILPTAELILRSPDANLHIRVGDKLNWDGETVEIVGVMEFEDAVIVRPVS